MSQGIGQHELQEKTQKLLQGPLKHVRAAALAAVLLPLASVAATPAAAQADCPSGGICGTVWNDTNNNGFQDAGEPAIEGQGVSVSDGTDTIEVFTDNLGFYNFFAQTDGPYTVTLLITGMTASPQNAYPGDDVFDSDGVTNTLGITVAEVTRTGGVAPATDFGFHTPALEPPGTGTPGYWKNHPDAWPVQEIIVGGIKYTKAQAISWLGRVGKDKTTTMFSSLVPAMLNVKIGNLSGCVSATIASANAWMALHHVGSNVAASSAAWAEGELLHVILDDYNNGRLCASHRD